MQLEQNRMDFRYQAIFFFDIDGTIKPFGKPPSSKTVEAVRILRRKGHLAFLCTGRPKWEIPSSVLSIGFDGIVGLAGAYVEAFGKILKVCTVSQATARNTIELILRTGADCVLQRWDGACHLGSGNTRLLFGTVLPSFCTAKQILAHPDCMRFSKFAFKADQLPLLQNEKYLKGKYILCKCAPDSYEMLLQGITKAYGIHKVLTYLQHGMENTWSFGDSENDIEMFQATEFSIAMGNADDAVKSYAGDVTKSVKEDGIYFALKHYRMI